VLRVGTLRMAGTVSGVRVNGTFLYNGTCSVSAARPARAETGADTPQAAHLVHGLVAIANGPDYCLCGGQWPCESRAS
jgi:hypothetical protein